MADRDRFSATGAIELVVRAQSVAGSESGCCPDCQEALELHQPEATDPDRLLGTCAECSGWFILMTMPAGDRALVLRLPTSDEFQRAVERQWADELRGYPRLGLRGPLAVSDGPCLAP